MTNRSNSGASCRVGRSRRLRVGLVVAAVASLVSSLVSSAAFAAGGTVNGTGASGASYSFVVTCATRSATVRGSLATASAFASVRVADSSGNVAPIVHRVGGTPTVSGPQGWQFATSLESAATSYRLDETSIDGVVTPVVAPVTTTDCPVYHGPGAQFFPISPTRLLDTRAGSQVGYTGSKPAANASVELQVTGVGGIPTDAVAVALNVTMTEASLPGFVQAFPTGAGSPGASSNINAETAGQTIPNSVIVPIGDNGKVTLYTSAGTHLIADASGYFVDATTPVAAGRFVSVTPRRVLDTRAISPLNYTGPTPAAGASVTVNPVTAAGLPAGQVAAVAINVTATESLAAGFVQVAPAGSLVIGASSSLNLTRAGQTIPNMVVVPVSATGEITVFTQRGTNLIVDVLGWFTNATAAESTAGLYVPVVPERVLDTRPETAVNFTTERRPSGSEPLKPAAASQVDVEFAGLPPDQVAAVVVNLTATEATAAGFVQGGATGSLTPGASSNVNVERAGQTIANAAIVPVDSGRSLSIFTQYSTNLIADVAGFFRA